MDGISAGEPLEISLDIQNVAHPVNTLGEPVLSTIKRDFHQVMDKVLAVFNPGYCDDNIMLRNWDLWGPLIICLVLGISLSIIAPVDQKPRIFTMMFVLMWGGSLLATINIKLLGGHISLFQCVSTFGYCMFPLSVAAVASVFVRMRFLKLIVVCFCMFLSLRAFNRSMCGLNMEKRRSLVEYPVFLFYSIVSWIIVIS